jgi:hypothetical protein
MINRQDQEVHDNGVALQAARDINITNGLNVADVKELAVLFFEKNLPALRAEAAAIARQNANEFLEEFVKKLAEPNTVTAEAFARPDSQACFSEALRSSAEKGDQIDLSFLASLVVRRLESDSDPLMKLVYEEAISVLPKLTGTQIAFLALIHFTKNLTINNATAEKLEKNASVIFPIITPGFGLSTSNKEYLCSKGVMSINLVADADLIYGRYLAMAGDLPADDASLKESHPNLHSIIQQYRTDDIPTCFLTSSGKIIALSAMERAYGKLNMNIWIN